MTMSMPWLPGWLRVLWAVLLCAVFALHLWHAWSMSGQVRWWHVAHCAMAAGMVVMYLFAQADHRDLYRAGAWFFGVLTLAMVAAGAVWWRRDGMPVTLWALAAIGMAVMTCMALPTGDRDKAVTWVLVGYLCAEVLYWLLNPLRRFGARRTGENAALASDVTPLLRVTLAVMAVSMAYMLTAMQFMHMHMSGPMMMH